MNVKLYTISAWLDIRFSWKRTIILLLLGLSFGMANAQEKKLISGIINDTETGEPLPGVNVLIKGTSTGTITNFEGKYKLEAGSNAILVFSYMGFLSQEITVGSQSTINVNLIADAEQLEEVVVVGYGEMAKREVSTAVATVGAQDLEKLPLSRVEQALQGNAPGVIVLQESGSPGAAMTVRIRGIGSANSSNPLYLVDGVQVPNLDHLNSGDIENISVLKDAASSAIYGARGGNGVVLVTTKSGRRNFSSPKVSISGYYGTQSLANKPDLMNKDEYIQYYNDSYDYYEAKGLTLPARGKFTDEEAAKLPDTDWYDVMFEDAKVQNYHANISDGGEDYSWSLGAGYYQQDGMIGGDAGKSNFERTSLRGSFEKDLFKGFNISASGSYAATDRNFLYENSQGTGNALMNYVNNMPPIYPTHAENGEVFNPGRQNPNPMYNGVDLPVIGAITNPVFSLELTNNRDAIKLMTGNIAASYEFDKFKFKTSYSYYGFDKTNKSFYPSYDYPEQTFVQPNASLTEQLHSFWRTQWDNTLQYTLKDEGDHNLTALVGTSLILDEDRTTKMTGKNLYVNNIDDANFALMKDINTVQVVPESITEGAWLSYFGRVNYSYKEKYLFSATLRADGSSKFSEENRWGYFPSVSAGWNVSQESFFDNIEFVDLLKVRASWGVNGNDQIGDYNYLTNLNTNAQYLFGNTQTDGIAPALLGNKSIKWEEVSQTNFGIDANLFNNKVGVTVDYFIKKTTDMLAPVGTPLLIGMGSPFKNVADVENSGLEILISHQNRVSSDLSYNIGFNLATVNNKVTGLGEGQPISSGNGQPAWADLMSKTDIGQPIASFYGYKVKELDENGNLIFEDLDGKEGITEDDRTFIGNPYPDFTYGITGGINYKGFDMNFFFFGNQGNDIYKAYLRPDGLNFNKPASFGNAWTDNNTNTSVARSNLFGENSGHEKVSDYYIEDGSFLRLKTLTVGYTLPSNITERIGASKVRFYVTAQNLFTITDYSGADPEIGQQSNNQFLDLGIDRGFYPQPRTFMGGFQLNF